MATARLSMRDVKEILRQKWLIGRTNRQIASALGISPGSVSTTTTRASAAGLDWATIAVMTEAAIERLLHPATAGPATPERPVPDCEHIHLELRRKHMTLALLHEEYLTSHPEGYKYTQYCEFYRRWTKRHKTSMRQVHRAGEKAFIDYAGMLPSFIDPRTGETVPVQLFLGVLGASNYTFAEATLSQQSSDFLQSHLRMLAFFGGAPEVFVPDQLKSGVTTPCRYEPGVQRTYRELAEHFGVTVIPARARRPKDKAKVEVAVLIAERWILARLRHQRFFSLAELNVCIGEHLVRLNAKVMKAYGKSRRELFLELDAPALKALPSTPFEYGQWILAKVNIDYHVAVLHHWYSVPHAHVHADVEARASGTMVEIFLRGELIAVHPRSLVQGRHTTTPEHMPKAHQKQAEWTPSRLIKWGETIGEKTGALVAAILASRPHPEQGYRSCLGLLRLGKSYGPDRLEAACARALATGARSYHNVQSILKSGLDRVPYIEADVVPRAPPVVHENVRGAEYYQ